MMKVWRKGNPCALGMKIGAVVENSMEVPQKKKKIELPYDLAIPLLGMYPEEMKSLSKKYWHPHVL